MCGIGTTMVTLSCEAVEKENNPGIVRPWPAMLYIISTGYHYLYAQLTGAGVSGDCGLATVLITVPEKWKDLGSVAHLVPSVAENIARGEIMRFSRVRVLVRSKVGTGLCSALSLLLIISVSSPPRSLQRKEVLTFQYY